MGSDSIENAPAITKQQSCLILLISEFERNIIRERTKSGLGCCKGAGRKTALNERQVREIRALLADPEIQVGDVARRYGVSRTTLYKYNRKETKA